MNEFALRLRFVELQGERLGKTFEKGVAGQRTMRGGSAHSPQGTPSKPRHARISGDGPVASPLWLGLGRGRSHRGQNRNDQRICLPPDRSLGSRSKFAGPLSDTTDMAGKQ